MSQVKHCKKSNPVPPSNHDKAHSIIVSGLSVLAHLDHGDYLGLCDDSEKSVDQKHNESDHKDKKESKSKDE